MRCSRGRMASGTFFMDERNANESFVAAARSVRLIICSPRRALSRC